MIMYIILAWARENLAQNVPCVKNAATLVCVGYNFHIRQTAFDSFRQMVYM